MVKRRPAETTAAASGAAAIVAAAVGHPELAGIIALVGCFVPAAVTAAYEFLTRNGGVRGVAARLWRGYNA